MTADFPQGHSRKPALATRLTGTANPTRVWEWGGKFLDNLAKIRKILRHRNATTTDRYLEGLGFQPEEIRRSVEVSARGPVEVIPLPRKAKAL